MAKAQPQGELPLGADTSGNVPEAPKRTKSVVKFLAQGFPFESREITERNWKALGIDHGPVVWNHANDWQVPASDLDFLDEHQFHTLIEQDSGFQVVEVDA